MKIDNEFVVPAPIDRAWEVLTDLPLIAPCMPGATLTSAVDGVYAGKIKVKVGPVLQEFAGTATFLTKDDVNHVAVIDAKGKDARGAGNASAVITATLRAEGDNTVATVNTDMKISGKLAQFGSGMIKEVSEKLLGAFVACLETKIAAPVEVAAPAVAAPAVGEAPVSEAPVSEAPVAEAPTAEPVLADAAGGAAVDGDGSLATAVAETEPGHGDVSAADTSPNTASASLRAPGQGSAPTPARTSPAHAAPVTPTAAAEPEPLDILALAGGSVAKRVVPVAIGAVVVVAAVVIYLVVRG